jgi:hypothetical protein
MTLEDAKRILAGEWVSLTPGVRPRATRNPGGTLRPFYLSREFKYLGATPAVLHVGGLDRAPSELFPAKWLLRLSVPAHGIDRLARFVREHYVRDAAGTPRRTGSGYYPRSWFYLAEDRYHALTYNSNNWTATALGRGRRLENPS